MGVREIEIAGRKLVINEQEEVCEAATGRALTGSWVWDSSLVLAEWVCSQGLDLNGKTVVELGAGMGIPGLTAALLGAARVIVTDVEALLGGLRKNVEANGLGDRVEVRRLVWGSDSEEWVTELEEEEEEVELVLMSDVFFDATEMAALAETVKRVCGKDTKVWGASEVRPWTSECLNELRNEGFGIAELASPLGGFRSAGTGDEGPDVFCVFQLFLPAQSPLISTTTL